eukprot:745652-Hanusia_phi.AAC.4
MHWCLILGCGGMSDRRASWLIWDHKDMKEQGNAQTGGFLLEEHIDRMMGVTSKRDNVLVREADQA